MYCEYHVNHMKRIEKKKMERKFYAHARTYTRLYRVRTCVYVEKKILESVYIYICKGGIEKWLLGAT